MDDARGIQRNSRVARQLDLNRREKAWWLSTGPRGDGAIAPEPRGPVFGAQQTATVPHKSQPRAAVPQVCLSPDPHNNAPMARLGDVPKLFKSVSPLQFGLRVWRQMSEDH